MGLEGEEEGEDEDEGAGQIGVGADWYSSVKSR